MMKKSKCRAGFSLLELVIAVSLASLVLIAVASIASQMARQQVEGMRDGTSTGWSVISYMAMAKEIEDSNVLAYPSTNGTAADAIVLCKNWSRMLGPLPGSKLANTDAETGAVATVSIVQYCLDTTTDPTNYFIRRFENTGTAVACPNPAAPVACTSVPGGTWTKTDVVGYRVERLSGASLFTRDNSVGGLRMQYVIGRQTATTNDPNPKSTPFDIKIAMSKQYSSTLD